MATGSSYAWWLFEPPERHKSKKQRKKEYREFRYNRALRNWIREEPPEWRLISHWLWQRRKPKED